jgi:hypothetical protein
LHAQNKAKKLSSSFKLNNAGAIIECTVKRNSLLFIMSVDTSSRSVEGSTDKHMTPALLKEAFSAKFA